MDAAMIANKLHSFAPGIEAYKGPPYDQPDYINDAIKNGRDIFGRGGGEGLVYVGNARDVAPWFVQANPKSDVRCVC
jgi:hypothetical protein